MLLFMLVNHVIISVLKVLIVFCVGGSKGTAVL